MVAEDGALLPLDFIVVRASRGGTDVAHFERGRVAAGPRPGARVVLHSGLETAALAAWQATGALCVRAERALALVAPAAALAPGVDARDLGEQWVHAVAGIRPNAEVLRAAATLLSDDDASLRSLLHRALAELAMRHLRVDRPASPPGASVAAAPGIPRVAASVAAEPAIPSAAASRAPTVAVPLADTSSTAFESFEAAPHDALDAAFAHLRRHAAPERPFEPRAAQLEMAHAVLDALLERRDLVVEAGTGIGKTLAYALPAVLLVVQRGDRIVLSTHTRNLQHQLVGRDLPWLWSALGLGRVRRTGGGHGLRYAKLLGRENYVCRNALAHAARAAGSADFELAQALVWSLASTSGELAEIAPFVDERVRRTIASRREVCGGPACRGEAPCPVYAARETARRADLVVVNHALLFSDALADGGILGRTDGLVLDEAHHLDAVATEHLSVRVGRAQSDALVAPLAHLDRRNADVPPRVRAVGRDIAAARGAILGLLDALSAALQPTGGAARTRQRYRDGDEVFAPVRAEVQVAGAALDRARAGVADLRQDPDAVAEDASPALDAIDVALGETRAALDFVTTAGDDDWAFALDLDARGVQAILAMPLDVAPAVRRLLATGSGAVYTSATLAAGDDLGAFVRRVGLPESTAQRLLPSPFDYASQCLVALAQHLPPYDDPAHVPAAAALVAAVARRTGRRMLILCTAHATLRRLHAALLRELGARAPVFAQDVSGSRETLAARFAATPGAVLLGTASFWEGVDFPGDALEVLVIGKLPFRPPDDPLVEARCERLKARGEDPFGDYLLPDAVLRFRQGFGRLVRTQRDRGVVLLLDPRLGERNYGGAFRRSLPVAPEVFHADEPLVERVAEWFDQIVPAAAPAPEPTPAPATIPEPM